MIGLGLAGPLVHCLTVLELLLKAGFQLHQLLINVCILNNDVCSLYTSGLRLLVWALGCDGQ